MTSPRPHGSSYSGVLTEDILLRLARMLGYPRAGGRRNSRRNLWYRSHKLLHERHFIRAVQKARPIAPAIYRFVDDADGEEGYEPFQKWCVLDFDVKKGWDNPKATMLYAKIWEYVEKIDKLWSRWGFSPCLTHSASKGYHLWLLFDEEVPASYVRGLMKQTAEELELDIMSGKFIIPEWIDVHGEIMNKKGQFLAEIDPMDRTDDSEGGIVKAPFSHHQAKIEYMEMPILVEHLRDYQPTEWPSTDEIGMGVEVFETWRESSAELLKTTFKPQERVAHSGQKRGTIRTKKLPVFKIPDESDKKEEIREIYDTLPCFKTATDKSATKEVSYWLRAALTALLTARGYSREDISIWIRDYINDADDNLNPGQMIYQVNYWSQAPYLATCRTFQNVNGQFRCCDNPCGRDSPLEDLKRLNAILDIPDVIGKTVMWELARARKDKKPRQFFKTTRSKMTTTVIRDALIHNDRMACIEPHTKIIETVQTAFDLYYKFADGSDETWGNYGVYETSPKYGAIMPDVRECCLKLKLQVEAAKEEFKSEDPALSQLPFVSKPSCHDCPYADKFLDMPPGSVLSESDIQLMRCLYATIMNNLDKFDVLVFTNKKLHALVMAARANLDNEFDGTIDSLEILDWVGRADVILLDEVSMYVDVPDIAVCMLKTPSDKRKPIYDITEYIEDQLRQTGDYKLDDVFHDMKEVCDDVMREMKARFKTSGISVYNRVAETEEKEVVVACLKRLQSIARQTNVAHGDLFNALIVSEEAEWIIVEEPDQDYDKVLSLYIAPKFGDIHRDFLENAIGRVIATDATMPLVDIGELLDQDFEKVNLGDPEWNTYNMRIIPYQKKFSAYDMAHWKPREELKTFHSAMARVFDPDNTVFSTTNSGEAYRFMKYELATKSQVIWYRGSESVGVSNDRRVMAGICGPYSPKDAHNWKKDVLYPELLRDYTHEQIWFYDAVRAWFQTMGRVKDPNGFYRSVFLGFGMTQREIETMAVNCVGVPEIMEVAYTNDKDLRPIIPVLVAGFYYHLGETLTVAEQLAAATYWVDPAAELEGRRFNPGNVKETVDADRLLYIHDVVTLWHGPTKI